MALVKCRECGHEVSKKAKKCPQCGVDAPGRQLKDTLAGVVVLVIVGLGLVMWMSSPGGDDEEKPDATVDADATAEEQAARDAECLHDLQCLSEQASIRGARACIDGIERLAAHDVEWTDGFLESKFSRSAWIDEESAQLRLFGDKVKFQNGFGAWTNMVYACDLDMSEEKPVLLDVNVQEGRI